MAAYVKKAPTSGAVGKGKKTRYMTLCGNLIKYYEDDSMKVGVIACLVGCRVIMIRAAYTWAALAFLRI